MLFYLILADLMQEENGNGRKTKTLWILIVMGI